MGKLKQQRPDSEKPMSIEVRTSYTFNGGFALDDAATKVVGRISDFSGCGCNGNRDLGWIVETDFEAQRIKRSLDKIGLHAEIKKIGDESRTGES